MEVAISLKNVFKHYNAQPVLNGLDLTVNKQCVFAFLGANGAGKSTTIKLMAGLEKPDKGEVALLGLPLHENKFEVLRQVGFLIDAPSYYPNLTAKEFLSIAARLKGIGYQQVDFILDYVGLGPHAHKLIKHFSLGMRQRVSLANALVGNPKLVVIDEPTNGLDPKGIKEIRELIKALPSNFGCTVFMSCHNLEEVQKTADQFAVLSSGKLVYQSSIQAWRKSLEKGWRLQLSNPQDAIALFDKRAVGWQQEGDVLIVDVNCQQQMAEIHALLIQQGIHLYTSTPIVESLESWFLEHS